MGIDASKSSMGMDISPIDLLNIDTFASRVIGLTDYRKELSAYLQSKMGQVAPNLATLIGDVVGARLISHAGSLTNLAKAPASTVQILGAEKALFRALRTRGNTPKYGLIFHSSFIGRAGAKNKGRISRYLANKCSIASRIDCFSETSTSIFGTSMKQQVEDRLKFYETGDLPRKNVDVMTEAMAAAGEEAKANKKKEKKEKKKRKIEETETGGDTNLDTSKVEESSKVEETVKEEDDTEQPPKNKKKKKDKEKDKENEEVGDTTANTTMDTTMDTTQNGDDATPVKKKKKKKDKNKDEAETELVNGDAAQVNGHAASNGDVNGEAETEAVSEKQKKKKKKKEAAEAE